MNGKPMHIDSLWIYPIKGCRGQEIKAADITTEGLAGDRRFVVTSEGQPMGQKTLPDLKYLSARWQGANLQLSFKQGTIFELPDEAEGLDDRLPLIGRSVGVVDMGPSVASWLSSQFGRPLRLVSAKAPEPVVLPLPAFASLEDQGQSKMVDVAPILLVNQASLDDLNARLDEPVPMDRFRANVVVSGLKPYEEDNLQTLTLGLLKLKVITPCERCAVTTFDQRQAETAPSKEPLRTLSTYRRLPTGYAGGVIFGSYCTVVSEGRLAVGDRLKPAS